MGEQPKAPKKSEAAIDMTMESSGECPHCHEEIVIEVACHHGTETVLRYTVHRS